MKRLSQRKFSLVACDHILKLETPFVVDWLKEHCERFMSREEVFEISQNYILWSAYYFKYGIRETKNFFWESYNEIDWNYDNWK